METEFDDDDINDSIVHIRVQPYKSRKHFTLIECKFTEVECTSMVKKMKIKFSCGGHVKLDKDTNQYVCILNGDHRQSVCDFLVKTCSIHHERIVIHGG